MKPTLHLTIGTPAIILVDAWRVTALRAEDESGCFGILPGHADFLTALVPTVIRWREIAETGDVATEHFCAVKGGVMRVNDGERVSIACREGIKGDSLPTLEARVHAAREQALDTARSARVEDMRLQAQALRRLLRYLRPQASAPGNTRATNEDLTP
jgi:F-type H+-transporting ATPase subunit epsilon